jgi:hypothetical protein
MGINKKNKNRIKLMLKYDVMKRIKIFKNLKNLKYYVFLIY